MSTQPISMCVCLPASSLHERNTIERLEHRRRCRRGPALPPASSRLQALEHPCPTALPLPQLDVLLISEDSDNHENNVLWSYDIPRREQLATAAWQAAGVICCGMSAVLHY